MDGPWYSTSDTGINNINTGLSIANWVSTTNKSDVKKTAKKQARYPIFETCAKLSQESMWIDIFTEASKGKFPTHISYREGNLMYKKGTRLSSVSLPEDPLEAFNLCKGFIASHTGLRSLKEQKFESEFVQRTRSAVEYNLWSKVKNLSVRDQLIYNYAEYIYNHLQINVTQSYKLVAVVKLGIALREIRDEHIKMYNNQIFQITNISRDPITQAWIIQAPKSKVVERTTTFIPSYESKQSNDSFDNLWGKFLTKKHKAVSKSMNSRQNSYSTYSMFSQVSQETVVEPKNARGRPPLNNKNDITSTQLDESIQPVLVLTINSH